MKAIRLLLTALLFVAIGAEAQTTLTTSAKTESSESKNQLNTNELNTKEADLTKKATAASRRQNKIVAITGVRFAYPLVQKWIDDYNKINPDIQIIIEHRGTNDPAKYDILIEAYEPDAEKKEP